MSKANKLYTGIMVGSIIATGISFGTLGLNFANGSFADMQHDFANKRAAVVEQTKKCDEAVRDVVDDVDETNSDISNDKLSDSEYEPYQVQYGDTLTDLSGKYKISVDTIAKFNNLYDPDLIIEDEVLNIPTKPHEIK